jgi:pilus assembly protein CpaE
MTSGLDSESRVFLLQVSADAQRLDEVERKLKPSIPRLTRVGSVEDAETRAAQAGGRAFLVLVAQSSEREYLAKLVGIVSQYRGSIFFILVSGEIGASDYKQLIQSGKADWADENNLADEVRDIIARHSAPAPAVEAPDPRRPTVVSFVPSAGGVGSTTLAIETAVQLARRKGGKDEKVCLIDLDFQSSHVCDYLDLEPRLRVDEIIGAPHRLDAQLLDMFTCRHDSGIDVLAAPRGPFKQRPLSTDVLSALFDLIAQKYVHVLVDLPLAPYEWTWPMIAASQGVLAVGRNTIPGLRQLAETLAAVQSEPTFKGALGAVVNRCEIGLFGRVTRGDHIARVLRDRKPLFVREASVAVDCINEGAPMSVAHPTAKATRDIGALAAFCLALRPAGIQPRSG